MAAARSLDDGYVVIVRTILSVNAVVFRFVIQFIGIGEDDPFEHFRHEFLRAIHELVHKKRFLFSVYFGGANDESPPIAMTALSKKLLRWAKLSAVVGFQRRDDGLHHHCYCDDSRIEGADRAIPGIRLATAFSRPVSRKFNGRLRRSSGGPEGADQIFGSRL